ncbi:glycosyl transferase family 2 [Yimella lutea]|uniref:Glycosyl transferase family 2 n=1 Tax=Yimella lutea TaxID=587872 RepID=A0A542EE47_9MICO|nr:glycosyltransferase family 2 protein [Yimella lutea]TQJ13607.1 glycosyl transferase family 2 [Yimella lutea]
MLVIVPAHNESEQIADTIESVLQQSLPPTQVVVACDNCTDDTAAIAARYPVTVMETVDNRARKSGAMNQAWLAHGQDADFVLTMDADTTLANDTLEHLLVGLLDGRRRAAVCARYWAKDSTGLAWRLQRLEYARYDDTRELRGWRVQVASGAASLYRGSVLRYVVAEFDRPGPWDEHSLIEDYGLTLDLKTLGYEVRAAPGATVLTDTPDTFKELWQQRQRWGRGGVDECRKRGWTPATRRDLLAYMLFGFGLTMRLLWVFYVVLILVLATGFAFSLLGLVPLAVMWVERVSSAWRVPGRTWVDLTIAGTVLVEDVYGMFLETCTSVSIFKSLRSSQQVW